MPIYDFKCPDCGAEKPNVFLKKGSQKTIFCSACGVGMKKLFSARIHAVVESTMDGRDRGKVVQEKNTALKKKYAGYAHEEQNIRKKITKLAQDRLRSEESK